MFTQTDAQDHFLELRLAEQAILKQSLEEKGLKIRDLESEVRYLRDLVNEMVVAPRPQAAPAIRRRPGSVPHRWRS